MRFVVAALFVTAAFGQADSQPVERTFSFVHADTVQSQHEMATLIRAVLEVRDVRLDTDHRTLTVVATASQVTAAEWLLLELDKPANAAGQPHASAEFQLDGGGTEGTLRIFYLSGSRTIQELQESATVIRSTIEIRRLFTYNATRAIAVRGTPEQVAAAEFLWNGLDNDKADKIPNDFQMRKSGPENTIRLYRLSSAARVQDLQEATTLIRAIVEVRHMFTYNRTRTIVARGPAEQLAVVDWIVPELAKAPTGLAAASEPYRMDDVRGEGVVRLFRLPGKITPARLQSLAVEVRGETKVRRIFTYNAPRLIAVRGSEAQVAQAGKLIEAVQ